MKKLNKKGFTLVELLAVIVILALLIVVAVSTVGNVQDNAKKTAMKTEGNKILAKIIEDLQVTAIDSSYNFTYGATYSGGTFAKSTVSAKLVDAIMYFKDASYDMMIDIATNATTGVPQIEGSTFCIQDTTGAMTGTLLATAINESGMTYTSGKKCSIDATSGAIEMVNR